MKFKKKPIVIEAFKVDDLLYAAQNQWTDLPNCIIRAYAQGKIIFTDKSIQVHTLEGWLTAHRGNWIIEGIKGELYPCEAEIFEQTYERTYD